MIHWCKSRGVTFVPAHSTVSDLYRAGQVTRVAQWVKIITMLEGKEGASKEAVEAW